MTTYFADGSSYSYRPGEADAINIGWLDSAHFFPRGPVSQVLVAALSELGRNPVNRTRGHHRCDLCPRVTTTVGYLPPTVAPCQRNPYPLGSGEIRVSGANAETFAAPNLISHYVSEHGYTPPEALASAAIRAAAEFAYLPATTEAAPPDWPAT